MSWPRIGCAVVLGALFVGGTAASAQSTSDPRVDTALQRIGAFVERYYSRAMSVVADVRVRIQPMGRDLSPRGRARRLLYEMRVEWAADGDDGGRAPVVMLDLVEADGRPPKPDDEPECADPSAVSAEPLMVFLPERQRDFAFSWAGHDREAGRDTIVLDYRSLSNEQPTIEWKERCVSIDLPGMTVGKVWADADSGDVLRVDEHLSGMFGFRAPPGQGLGGGRPLMTIERADTSIRLKPVGFSDPDETLLLPSSIEVMTVWRNTGVQRIFTTHEISNYRRFVTDSRVITNPQLP